MKQKQSGLPNKAELCPLAGSSGPGCHGKGRKAGFSGIRGRPPPVHQRVVRHKPAALLALKHHVNASHDSTCEMQQILFAEQHNRRLGGNKLNKRRRKHTIHSFCTDPSQHVGHFCDASFVLAATLFSSSAVTNMRLLVLFVSQGIKLFL